MPSVMTDPAERRLRAARPPAAEVPADAAESVEAQALLARVRTSAPARKWRRRLALRVGAAVALAVAAFAVVAGLPGSGRGPQQALARPLELAVRWFDPTPGTVLHYRSTLTDNAPNAPASTLEQEVWVSADHPERARTVSIQDAIRAESGPDGVYDAARDTVYLFVPPGPRQLAAIRRSIEAKISAARAGGTTKEEIAAMRREAREAIADAVAASSVSGSQPGMSGGDPTVAEIRALLVRGDARVAGREAHKGVEAYVIEFSPRGQARAGDGTAAVRWTLRTRVSDGRPLQFRVDNGPGTPILETITWQTYELLSGRASEELLTVRGAHPDARVVRDPDALQEATERLYPKG